MDIGGKVKCHYHGNTAAQAYHAGMPQIQSKLTSQGQVSVPAAIRQALALTPGSALVWTHEDGRVTVQRAARHTTAAVHLALFGTPALASAQAAKVKPKTLAQLKQGIREHVKSRHVRD